MNYIKQVVYEMKHQKMMTWVSISGTALAIFLVMTSIMAEKLNTVEVAPVENRGRILFGKNIHVQQPDGRGGSTRGINSELAVKLYEGLEGVEMLSYVSSHNQTRQVNVKGEEGMSTTPISVDANFWKIYDFTFIDGVPFDEAAVESDAREVVVSRSLARALFGEEKVAGREIEIDLEPWIIKGVVEDVHPLLREVSAQFFKPFRHTGYNMTMNGTDAYWGSSNVRLLLKPGVKADDIKRQVAERYERINREIKGSGDELYYHGQPYTAEEEGIGGFGSNNAPDVETSRMIDYGLYAILILLPAINLSSMTRGRLRHRVAEIGVRRAFGAKKRSIVEQLFLENLIITLIGGIIGFAVSILFMLCFSSFFFGLYYNDFLINSMEITRVTPTVGMLFSFATFFTTLGFCFVLNVVSATVPAWKAARVEPAIALTSR